MIWVVGNRKVGGIEIPTRAILADFLKANHAVHVVTVSRGIPTKRMASKNNVSETMSKEHILIFRKG
jgi:site-specific DNA-methyltransferase (cytosine-N4-specific)